MFLVRLFQFEEENLLDLIAGFPSISVGPCARFHGSGGKARNAPSLRRMGTRAKSPDCFVEAQNIFRRIACW
jgi:hypothetical protein